MNSILILLLLILTSAFPAIILFFWSRRKTSVRVSLPWFLASLAAGIISLLIAALIQSFFPSPGSIDGLVPLFFAVFIRIAFIEETSRLITLYPFLKAITLRRRRDISLAAALGLAAGLGFAAAENAFYGMSDINITLLRIFTAAPLHGACGIRAGAAVFEFRRQPVRAVFLFLSAVIIHGAYNLIIVSPAVPAALAIPAALAALFISLPLLKAAGTDDENTLFSSPKA